MENGSIRQLLHNRHVAIVDGAMTDADRAGSARSQTRVHGLVAAAPLPSHAVGGRKRRPVWRVSGGRQRIHRRLRVERATIPGLPSRSHAGHGRIRRGPVRLRNHAEHRRSEGLDRSPTGRIPEHDRMAVVQPVRKRRYGGWHGPGRSRLLHPERVANRSRRRQLRADGPCASSNSGHPTGYGQADHRVSEQR